MTDALIKEQHEKFKQVLQLIDCEVRTAHLDMGGNHKYAISIAGQQRIGKALQTIKQDIME